MAVHMQPTNHQGLDSLELSRDGKFLLLPLGHRAEELYILCKTKSSEAIELFVENNLALALVGFFHYIWACV